MEITEAMMTELKKFLDNDGRLTSFPAKKRNKIISLVYLSNKFEQEKIYTEKEVNAIIEQFHTFGDKWLLRRELINNGFLSRLVDGSQYWLSKEQPEIDLLSTC